MSSPILTFEQQGEGETPISTESNALITYTIEQVENQSELGRSLAGSSDARISYSCRYIAIEDVNGYGSLKQPLIVKSETVDGLTYLVCEELDITVSGDDDNLAVDEFISCLLLDWQDWEGTPDDQLTGDARELKSRFGKYFGSS